MNPHDKSRDTKWTGAHHFSDLHSLLIYNCVNDNIILFLNNPSCSFFFLLQFFPSFFPFSRISSCIFTSSLILGFSIILSLFFSLSCYKRKKKIFLTTVLEMNKQKEIADVLVKLKHFLMCYLSLRGFLKIFLSLMKVIVLSSSPRLPKYFPA